MYIDVFVVSQYFKITKFYFSLQFEFCLQLIIVSAPCYNLHHCLGHHVHLYHSHHQLISLHSLKYSFIEIINIIIPSCLNSMKEMLVISCVLRQSGQARIESINQRCNIIPIFHSFWHYIEPQQMDYHLQELEEFEEEQLIKVIKTESKRNILH